MKCPKTCAQSSKMNFKILCRNISKLSFPDEGAFDVIRS